jgi:transcriptional regulator with PAS, ATPase and Fis domain
MNTVEIIKLILEILVVPLALTICGLIWKKIIKPVANMAKGHDYIVDSIKEIKNELTTNGGSSIKDAINRIEGRQIVVDHRTKAIFYNFDEPLFEIDNEGNMLWSNEKFKSLCDNENFKGLDWILLVDEPKRQEFIEELQSCSKQNREIRVKTQSMNGNPITFRGFPYRSCDKNYGFLIYLKGE